MIMHEQLVILSDKVTIHKIISLAIITQFIN